MSKRDCRRRARAQKRNKLTTFAELLKQAYPMERPPSTRERRDRMRRDRCELRKARKLQHGHHDRWMGVAAWDDNYVNLRSARARRLTRTNPNPPPGLLDYLRTRYGA